MGLFDFVKSQFIEVIEWTDAAADIIVYRFPVQGNEIKMGAQLIVRESQAAIFVNEGKIADVFTPGRYQLSTQNMPVLTKLKSWSYGFNSPFKAEVYFVNTKQFTDQKWGTANPIMMRDAEFGMLRLRAFGIFSFRVADPAVFLREIFGTNAVFDTESITGQLKRALVSGLADMLGEAKIPALDLVTQYDELSEAARSKLQPRFEAFGLQLTSLYIENISLPEEVEKVLDKRTAMGVIGNMQQYAQYQTAEAIRDAAQNQGGIAGMGVGLGAGAAIGNLMGQAMGQIQQPQAAPAQAPPAACVKCRAAIQAGAKFCPACGAPQTARACAKCGTALEPAAKFCPECGTAAS